MKHLSYLILAIVLMSCTVQPKEEKESKSVFRYNEPGGITSLDPAFARSLENVWVMNQVFNGLVQMNADLEVQPCIANDWWVSDDGLEYTFVLRDDVYFHDSPVFEGGKGRRVIADDFVHSFYRIVDKKVASPGAYIFNSLDRSEKSGYLGFKAHGDDTLKIYLNSAFPPFLGLLTMQYCAVIPHEAVERFGNDFRRNPVGTGPFMFKTWKEGEKLVLVRNDHYFEKDIDGNALPYLDAVSVSFLKDPQAEYLGFLKGNYDFKSGISQVYKDEILTREGELAEKFRGKFKMEKQPWLETIYLGVLVDDELKTTESSPLKVRAVRNAINYGFDRAKMVKYLRNDIGTPATSGFVPKGMPSFDADEVKGYSYDPEKAKDLLLVGGFPDAKDLPTVRLLTTTMYEDLCEYIQHELAGIGMTVEIEVIDEATFREMVAQSKVNWFTKSWVADYPDAENFLALFYSKNFCPVGPNYTHFDSYKYDKLYESAMAEVDDSARYVLYREMDKMIVEESPVMPLYYNELVRFTQNNISGLESNPMNLLTLKRVKKN